METILLILGAFIIATAIWVLVERNNKDKKAKMFGFIPLYYGKDILKYGTFLLIALIIIYNTFTLKLSLW